MTKRNFGGISEGGRRYGWVEDLSASPMRVTGPMLQPSKSLGDFGNGDRRREVV